jgi:hypothetical protein
MSETHTKSLEHEAEEAAKRAEIISKVTLEVEGVFLREHITFRELQEIFNKFMDRQVRVAETITVNEAKERFNNL